MHWNANQNDVPVRKIAKKDIECYKVVWIDPCCKTITSAIMKHAYTINVEETTCLDEPRYEWLWIPRKQYGIIAERWIPGNGFYSCKMESDATFWRSELINEFIVKCTIPKGAEYYENEHEYVSDKIIIKEVLE